MARTSWSAALLALTLAGIPATAAPPALISSAPADTATGMPITAIRLGFDQAVLAEGPRFVLRRMATAAEPVDIAAVNHDGPDKLDLGLARPLTPGRYELAWQVANTAGETRSGILHFGIRR